MTHLLLAGNLVSANWGRWVAGCASPYCDSAMQVWPGQQHTVCGDCGHPIRDLVWPADPEAIETLLMMRPAEKTRNWLPSESLEDLLAENLLHGIMPPGLDQLGQAHVMTTIGGRLTGGLVGLQLRGDVRRHEIEAAMYEGKR